MLKRLKKLRFTTVIAILILFVAVVAAVAPSLLAAQDPYAIDLQVKLQGPSAAHWLGTDEYGRDLWARIVYGARNSMEVGFGSAALALLIGVPLGLIAGFFGGLLDNLIMRIMDGFLSFPSMLLAILLMTIFKASALTLILTIAIVSFPAYGRIVRSSVLSLKNGSMWRQRGPSGQSRGISL